MLIVGNLFLVLFVFVSVYLVRTSISSCWGSTATGHRPCLNLDTRLDRDRCHHLACRFCVVTRRLLFRVRSSFEVYPLEVMRRPV